MLNSYAFVSYTRDYQHGNKKSFLGPGPWIVHGVGKELGIFSIQRMPKLHI